MIIGSEMLEVFDLFVELEEHKDYLGGERKDFRVNKKFKSANKFLKKLRKIRKGIEKTEVFKIRMKELQENNGSFLKMMIKRIIQRFS